MNAKGYPTRDEVVSALSRGRAAPSKGLAGLSLAALMAVLGGCAAEPNAAPPEPESTSQRPGVEEQEIMGTFDANFDE